jgi:predicted GH43/DUF377 family glycosyl hydrolase
VVGIDFSWEKLGRVFSPSADAPGHSWIQSYAQSPAAILLADRIRVFFCSRESEPTDGQFLSRIFYADVDRLDPTKLLAVCEEPVIELGGLGSFDQFGMNPLSVVRAGNELRIYYAGWTRCQAVPFNSAIGMVAGSTDDGSFSRFAKGPVLSYAPDEPFTVGSPRIKSFDSSYYLWYAAGRKWMQGPDRPEPIYKIRLATSVDGTNWKRFGADLISDVLGEDECQASAEVIAIDGHYHMFFSYRPALGYKEPGNGYRIGYAQSNDLTTWTRDDSRAGIGMSDDGWDSESVSYSNLLAVDDETYMFYQGNGMGESGFGVARLAESS